MWLNRYSRVVVFATFLLLLAGASVTSTGSGLAVPDWPLSYGSLFPPMVGGILFEHGHRMIATTVGILVLVLAAWLARSREPRWVRKLGFLAVGLVVTQGLLGGLTVLLLLPTAISVAHAAVAMAFFSLIVCLAIFTSPAWKDSGARVPERGTPLFRIALAVTLLLYAQVLIGAWVRHTGSGLAYRDFPLMNGSLWPRVATFGEAAQLAHRLTAVLVAGAIVAVWVIVRRRHPGERRMTTLASAAIALLVLQILLGGASVWTGLAPLLTVAHHGNGALLLGTMVTLTVWTRRRILPERVVAPSPGRGIARGVTAESSPEGARA